MRRNPKGREIGFGRGIRLTEAGRKHPMYTGKPEVFNAPTVHLDEVEALPPGTVVLATNAVSDVQSAEIHYNGAVAWGVQYHPEYPLREIAAIVRRIGSRLIEEGFFLDEDDIKAFAGDSTRSIRTPPTSGWPGGTASARMCSTPACGERDGQLVEYQVLPKRAKRGRVSDSASGNLKRPHGFLRSSCGGDRRHRRARHRRGRRADRSGRGLSCPMAAKQRRSIFRIAAARQVVLVGNTISPTKPVSRAVRRRRRGSGPRSIWPAASP